jgi:osmotically inducible protein OsmC
LAVARRKASIVWEGDVRRGSGRASLDSSGAFGEFGMSLPTRTQEPEGHTSPEELLAAAHVGCYAMALSLTLGQAGNTPERLEIGAEAVLDRAGEGFAITTLHLWVRGKVPNVDQQGFEDAARQAEQGCPVSNALRGIVEIELDAQLDEG